jgi:RNA polymerase sigma-70 factor (ECF subfamily)
MSEPFSDQTLIEDSQRGSPVAFDALMQRYERLVYAVAWAYTRERESALDVTQEVFLKVYRKLGAYRGTGSFRSWLLRIAGRESLNWLRRHRRYRQAEELPEDRAAPDEGAPESGLLRTEGFQRLRAGVDRLPPRQRLAVRLRYFQGLPVREVAAAMGCSEGTGKNLLFRGVQKLREQLAECTVERSS